MDAQTYTIGCSPAPPLAWTNNVYVSADECNSWLKAREGSSSYVRLLPPAQEGRPYRRRPVAYQVKVHRLLGGREIGLSKFQRQMCGNLEPGQEVLVQACPLDAKRDALLRVEMAVSLWRTPDSRAPVAAGAAEVAQQVLTKFSGHPLTVDQAIFLLWLDNSVLCLTVKSCSVRGGDSAESSETFVDSGLLTADTVVLCKEGEPSRQLRFDPGTADLVRPGWKFSDMNVGGLDDEFEIIFRRAFASRLYSPALIERLGTGHLRGLLLYGPPGTGKTLIASQIGAQLRCAEFRVVNGPELFRGLVGSSEQNVRDLFAPAERDYAENKERAGLHIIFIDEIDSLAGKRGGTADGTGVRDAVVNQLLSKIDGAGSVPNVLVIGATNRKDRLDPAILRAGRLELHLRIGLPDARGRQQIFRIHTKKMREGLLSSRLSLRELARRTPNFTGAEIKSVVATATSFALYRHVAASDQGGATVALRRDAEQDVRVTSEDFDKALDEVVPMLGVDSSDLAALGDPSALIEHGARFGDAKQAALAVVRQVTDGKCRFRSLLLHGEAGSGTSSLAAFLAHQAVAAGFPLVKVVSPRRLLGLASDAARIEEIRSVFEDAYKSVGSVVVLDCLERLIDYSPVGPRFSNAVLQALATLVEYAPPSSASRLLIVATTSQRDFLRQVGGGLDGAFHFKLELPLVTLQDEYDRVLAATCGPRAPAEAPVPFQPCTSWKQACTMDADGAEDKQQQQQAEHPSSGPAPPSLSIKRLLRILDTVTDHQTKSFSLTMFNRCVAMTD